MQDYSRCISTAQEAMERYTGPLLPMAWAIERGKLADLLFEDPRWLSHRALRRIVGGIGGMLKKKATSCGESPTVKEFFIFIRSLTSPQAAGNRLAVQFNYTIRELHDPDQAVGAV